LLFGLNLSFQVVFMIKRSWNIDGKLNIQNLRLGKLPPYNRRQNIVKKL
jgi:hypothetical protein